MNLKSFSGSKGHLLQNESQIPALLPRRVSLCCKYAADALIQRGSRRMNERGCYSRTPGTRYLTVWLLKETKVTAQLQKYLVKAPHRGEHSRRPQLQVISLLEDEFGLKSEKMHGSKIQQMFPIPSLPTSNLTRVWVSPSSREYRTSNINSCKRSTGTQGWLLTGWMMAARGPGGGGLRWRWRWRWAVQGAVLGEWMMKRI